MKKVFILILAVLVTFVIGCGGDSSTGTPKDGDNGGNGGNGQFISVSGRIIDSSGNGIAGVKVAMGNGQDTTDENGNYSIPSIIGGYSYRLTPSKSGYTFSPSYKTINVPENEPVVVPDIVGIPVEGNGGNGGGAGEADISGRITDSTGAGIAGVEVILSLVLSQWDTTTDSNGYYSFDNVSNGGYAVLPTKKDYTFTPQFYSFMFSGSALTYNFTGSTEQEQPSVGENTITGKVIDTAGKGIPNVEVEITGESFDDDVDTDPSGNYSFENLLDGTYTLTPSKGAYTFSPETQELIVAGADKTADDFTGMPEGGENGKTVSGKVIDADGAGIEGVFISLVTLSNFNLSLEQYTDAQGNYSIVNVPDATYYVTPEMDDYNFTPLINSITVAGADVTVNDISGFVEGSYTVSGKVVDSSGNGISQVMVYLFTGGLPAGVVITDGNGNYTIEDVPNQHYTVKVTGIGYTFTPAEINITVNGADVTVQNFVGSKGSK